MLQTLLQTNKPLALLLIKAQKSVFSTTVGDNSAKSKGSGFDFIGLQEYTSGDDIKHIDWVISSKLDKPYVKTFQEHKELNIILVPLLNASLHFGVKSLKITLLQEVLALLSFSAIKQGDPFESYICTDKLSLASKKSKQVFGVGSMLEKVNGVRLLGKEIDYKVLSSELYKRVKQRSLLFLVGDFLQTMALELGALALKHEVVLIILRDRFEESPSILGEVNVTDPLSGATATLLLDKEAVAKIEKKRKEEDVILEQKLQKQGIKFVKIYTDENPFVKLLPLMSTF